MATIKTCPECGDAIDARGYPTHRYWKHGVGDPERFEPQTNGRNKSTPSFRVLQTAHVPLSTFRARRTDLVDEALDSYDEVLITVGDEPRWRLSPADVS